MFPTYLSNTFQVMLAQWLKGRTDQNKGHVQMFFYGVISGTSPRGTFLSSWEIWHKTHHNLCLPNAVSIGVTILNLCNFYVLCNLLRGYLIIYHITQPSLFAIFGYKAPYWQYCWWNIARSWTKWIYIKLIFSIEDCGQKVVGKGQ